VNVRPRPLRTRVYALHRWIGLVVSLQLLAWALGGAIFSILPIDDVRGDRERRREPRPALAAVTLTPADALARAEAARCGEAVARLVLQMRLGRAMYDVIDPRDRPSCMIDATTGEVRREITADEASLIARADFAADAKVVSISRIEASPPLEYRGKPLPAYQVVLEHPKQPHLYVAAATGEVTARRNGRWRLYDFFWMLHIMDYRERESHNHLLLTFASVLAIVSAMSGVALHGYRWTTARSRTR